MKIYFELIFRGAVISATFDGYTLNEANEGFWRMVAEEEGQRFADDAKLFGVLYVNTGVA